jgi:hypothetical protein
VCPKCDTSVFECKIVFAYPTLELVELKNQLEKLELGREHLIVKLRESEQRVRLEKVNQKGIKAVNNAFPTRAKVNLPRNDICF